MRDREGQGKGQLLGAFLEQETWLMSSMFPVEHPASRSA